MGVADGVGKEGLRSPQAGVRQVITGGGRGAGGIRWLHHTDPASAPVMDGRGREAGAGGTARRKMGDGRLQRWRLFLIIIVKDG